MAARAERAERGLEDQATAFGEMRDLLINGGASVDALTRRAVALRARLPEGVLVHGPGWLRDRID